MNGLSQVQVYQFTTPITGYMTMSAVDRNGPSGSSGGFVLQFNTLTETVYLDAVNETIRQVGFVSVTSSNQSLSFSETQEVSVLP